MSNGHAGEPGGAGRTSGAGSSGSGSKDPGGKGSGAKGFRIARVSGIDITVDPSWLIIFFLILWTFSDGVFPAAVPGRSPTIYWVMGAAGTLLFFVSLLLHELAHSWVAIRKGIRIEGITLFVFGGMARTASEPKTPDDELKIAGAGPLMSLALGVLFYGIARLSVSTGLGDPIAVVASHLATLNLALAVFNMVPGFPLDGGRVFRALIWKSTGDLEKATRIASNGGRLFGALIVFLGVLGVLGGQLIGGLWFIFIGWFLTSAARASYQQFVLKDVLEGVNAAAAMSPDPETVHPHLTLDALVHEHVLRRPYNAFPVVEGGVDTEPVLVGLITLTETKKVPRDEWPSRTVGQTMIPVAETLVVTPETPMNTVLQRMAENGARRVVVAERGHLRGIITTGDIANWIERAGLLS